MKAFLIEHNRSTGRNELTEFDDVQEALAQLRKREAERDADTEVVLLFARSQEDLRNTHSRYFYSLKEIVRRGRDADAASELSVAG